MSSTPSRRFVMVGTLVLAASLAGIAANAASPKTAIFAGGCFWCMQGPFNVVPGVTKTVVGYTGGHVANPTYEQVSTGTTGHAESVEVTYDPDKVSYDKLLDVFWHNIDPVAVNAQFCDHGTQYRTAIFYTDAAQEKLAEASKAKIDASGRFKGKVATQIVKAGPFYPAETYHQDFYIKSSAQYEAYRAGCGRDQDLKTLWGKDAPKH